MNTKKTLSAVFSAVFLVVFCAIGIFSLIGCGSTCAEHDFRVNQSSAACEKPGMIEKICNNCGFTDYEETEALGHTFGEWEVTLEATCQEIGERTRYCESCDAYETEEISTVIHTVNEWTVYEEPTESSVGLVYGVCAHCQRTISFEVPILTEDGYTEVENIDSESKEYTYKTEGYEVKFIVSNYYFISSTDENGATVYEIGASKTISTEKLVLPSTYNGYPIIGICPDGFMGQTAIKEVVIPEGYKYIRSFAFGNCENLEKVTLPSTVEGIGMDYYGNSTSIFNTFVDSLYYDGTGESWCEIKLYDSISVENIYFKNESGEYDAVTEITIPESVTEIGKYQFFGFSDLSTINMHDGITSIGESAFQGSGLTSVTIPNNVTSIGIYAFASCESLTDVVLSSKLETIDRYVFAFCSSLEKISIPAKVKYINEQAFVDCYNLSAVEFDKNSLIMEIGREAFNGCSQISELLVPATLETVKQNAIPLTCKTLYYMSNATAFDYIEGKNFIRFSDSTIYYYSEKLPTDSTYKYWHFDENDEIAIWVLGKFVNNKRFVYSHTEATVSDVYWQMLKAVEAQGMLEMVFSSLQLGEELANRHIEMVVSSSTKEEYVEKLCDLSSESGQNTSYKFENGKLTVTLNGVVQIPLDYVEFENTIYLANGAAVCYVDPENNLIYEKNETEYSTVWHYFELAND